MAKFHITEAGDPAPCSATVRACPRGGEDKHFGSEAEAREAFAAEQGGSFAAPLRREAPAMPVAEAPFSLPVLDYHPQDDYPGMLEYDDHIRLREDVQVQRRQLAVSPGITAMVPREGQYEQYYADTDKKHFSDKAAPGSKFTDPTLNSLEDVTAMALQQRGDLAGDDREELIAAGANPAAFGPNFRYLKIRTNGTMGSAPLSSFPEGTEFHARRTKTGGKVSLVAIVDTQPNTDFGVLVIGTPPGVDHEVVVTAHPGAPSRSTGNDTFASVEGQRLTAADVARVAGTSHVNVNTVLRSALQPAG